MKLRKRKIILVTAGPTREHLDPVRFISNLSSGRLGYEIAREAHTRGYRVILISGPTNITPPQGVRVIHIVSAQELERAVLRCLPTVDVIFMTSAVCDYRPTRFHRGKIKRHKKRTLMLEATDDILLRVAARKTKQVVCGFCLETSKVLINARKKLKKKKLDFIVAHLYRGRKNPFGDNKISPIVLARSGVMKRLRPRTKKELARYVLNVIVGR